MHLESLFKCSEWVGSMHDVLVNRGLAMIVRLKNVDCILDKIN